MGQPCAGGTWLALGSSGLTPGSSGLAPGCWGPVPGSPRAAPRVGVPRGVTPAQRPSPETLWRLESASPPAALAVLGALLSTPPSRGRRWLTETCSMKDVPYLRKYHHSKICNTAVTGTTAPAAAPPAAPAPGGAGGSQPARLPCCREAAFLRQQQRKIPSLTPNPVLRRLLTLRGTLF